MFSCSSLSIWEFYKGFCCDYIETIWKRVLTLALSMKFLSAHCTWGFPVVFYARLSPVTLGELWLLQRKWINTGIRKCFVSCLYNCLSSVLYLVSIYFLLSNTILIFPFVYTKSFWNLYIQIVKAYICSDFSLTSPNQTLIKSATSFLPQSLEDTL